MTPIYSYQTQEVRDLAWACFSPSLMLASQWCTQGPPVTDCGLQLTPQRGAWLARLDRDPGPLREHLSLRAGRRLGIYFEHLWHFFLAQDPAVDLLAHNLPVYHGGQTVGEFDCIYFCRNRQRTVHLELAVKYFLSNRQSTAGSAPSLCSEWLGPNAADRLDLKLTHLVNRQIRLAQHPAARQLLHSRGIAGLDREIEMKGYLFQSLRDPLHPPLGCNPEHALEYWLDIGQLESYLGESDANSYLLLPRMLWLSRVQNGAGQRGITASELRLTLSERLAAGQLPLLVAALDDTGQEIRRFFVTGPTWPPAGKT